MNIIKIVFVQEKVNPEGNGVEREKRYSAEST